MPTLDSLHFKYPEVGPDKLKELAADYTTRRPFAAVPWLGANLWPLTVIRIWIRLVTDCLAHSKRPNSQQN
jgi:hypothetical protein